MSTMTKREQGTAGGRLIHRLSLPYGPETHPRSLHTGPIGQNRTVGSGNRSPEVLVNLIILHKVLPCPAPLADAAD